MSEKQESLVDTINRLKEEVSKESEKVQRREDETKQLHKVGKCQQVHTRIVTRL